MTAVLSGLAPWGPLTQSVAPTVRCQAKAYFPFSACFISLVCFFASFFVAFV